MGFLRNVIRQKSIAPVSQPIRIELKAIARAHALDGGHTYMFPDLIGSFDYLYGQWLDKVIVLVSG